MVWNFIIFSMLFSSGAELGVKPNDTEAVDFSDMALVSDNLFLAVSDRKNTVEPGCRVMLLTLTKDRGLSVQPVFVTDWLDHEQEPNDLEACCRLPGRENEFLLAESGFYKGKYGRIFHVTLNTDSDRPPSLKINGVMRIYNRPLDLADRTYSGDNVAGMVCFQSGGKFVLGFGERGGVSSVGTKLATLIWGELDLDEYQFHLWGESPLVNQSVLQARDCAALYLLPDETGGYSVISVATQDPGNNGPFYSVVYRAGHFVPSKTGERFEFEISPTPEFLAHVDGHKVEGVSGPVSNAPQSDFCIVTDDENLGGVWRAIVVDRR